MRKRRESNYGRKIEPEDVEDILRRVESESDEDIAQDYGVSRIMIHYIKTGKKWEFITRKQFFPVDSGYVEIKATYDPRAISRETRESIDKLFSQAEDLSKGK